MTQFYFPFTSIDGDRRYNAKDFATYFHSIFTDGVIATVKDKLRVSQSEATGMHVVVNTGAAFIHGHLYLLGEPLTVDVTPGNSTGDRVDSIVLQLDHLERDMKILYKQNSTNVQRDENYWELQIATINVPRNATQVLNSQINDMRASENVAGYSKLQGNLDVEGMEQHYESLLQQLTSEMTTWVSDRKVDFQGDWDEWFTTTQNTLEQLVTDMQGWTTDKQAEFETDWNTWFATVRDALDGDTAGELLSMITQLQTDLGNIDAPSTQEFEGLQSDFSAHQAEKVHQGEIHGFRLTDGKLEYFDGAEWQRVKGDGYPVGNVVDFTASVGNGKVTLKWGDPSDVTVEDSNGNVITIARWAGTKLIRKTGNFPVDENDGVLIVDNAVRNKYQTTGFNDTGRVNGTTYYYMLFPYTTEDVTTVDGANRASATPQAYDDLTGSPGPSNLIGGTMQAGFFGEVPASELFTASQIASACGITQGTAQHENEPWLKFAYEGKILFRPRKAIRHSISWDAINTAKCVYDGSDGKTVTKDGKQYRVRLMRGALTDPSKNEDADRGAKGSEWNKLMLPIHEQAIDKSWAYSAYVEDNVPIWAHNLGTGANGMYSDADLMTHYNHGNGSYVWQQETTSSNASHRVNRGDGGVSGSYSNTSSYAASNVGWAPVLELL